MNCLKRDTSEPKQEKDRDTTTLTASGVTLPLHSLLFHSTLSQWSQDANPVLGEGSGGLPVHKSTLRWWWLGLKSDKLHARKKRLTKQSRKRRAFKTFNRETKRHYTKMTSSPFACNPQG